jgi:hypothetical protein
MKLPCRSAPPPAIEMPPFVAYDSPVPDLSKSELCGRQRQDWKSKNEGSFRLMPRLKPCVIKLSCGSFALGDQHGDVVLLFVGAEAANGVHERGQQVRQRQVAIAA